MKRISFILSIIFLCAFLAGISNASASSVLLIGGKTIISKDKKVSFKGWSDEQFKSYEDSILSKLYPEVVACKLDEIPHSPAKLKAAVQSTQSVQKSYVPNSVKIDKTKAVGTITINSGTSPSGAKTYDIPISVYPGKKDFTPTLSLSYNSQQGNSTLGMGWSISGISMIVRGGKSVYYDGMLDGIKMDNNDSFMLNGVRLIKMSTAGDYILYESEQGNIKVKGFFTGTTLKYFEVFFPDGNKGIFGKTSNTQNQLYYPLISFQDLYGNTISYDYYNNNNHYNISKISYNGCSVEFKYDNSRNDPILTYIAGVQVYETKLLKTITTKYGEKVLGTYTLSYSVDKKKTLLTRVELSANGKSYNPISFYYGEGITDLDYTTSTTQLMEWYKSDDPNMIKVVKGKFDYDSDADGLIVLPNKNPYWKHYRSSNWHRHSQNRFDNQYSGDEKIFLYAGLSSNYASPMPNLVTEPGFVDILCGDLEGQQEEYIVKINDKVVDDNEQVTFKVYRSNLYTGLQLLYTRNYSFPTVYTDADHAKSIQPKYYYMGDFNGDGKMEILAVSVHQPFGDARQQSKCYIFDLINNKILYQNYVFPFNIDFVGVQQSDPDAAENNSDKLLVMDCDGDGKTDICHIDGVGVNVYTFTTSGTSISSAKKIATYGTLRKSDLADRRFFMGEFNGDGLVDILVSPTVGSSTIWTVYNSRGNGQFNKSTFDAKVANTRNSTTGYFLQDVNNDGTTDLIKYGTEGFNTYLTSNNTISYSCYGSSLPSIKSIFVPTNINNRNNFTQLISLKEGKVTKYSFSADYSKELMITGVVNSLGVIEKNQYSKTNEEGEMGGVFSKGYGAVYPYVNIHEPLTVIAASEVYVNGNNIEKNTYHYKNAVVHRQGLGFCGFEEVTSYDMRGRANVATYDPYRRGVMTKMATPTSQGEYVYTVSTKPNRLQKILLTKKTEKDLLKNITTTSTYTYDSFGYPTVENISYSDGTSIKNENTYSHQYKVANGYNLGFVTTQTSTITKGGETYTDKVYIPAFSNRQPEVRIQYKNDNIVKEETFSYNYDGNIDSSSVRDYSSKNCKVTSYEYNSYGKPITITDHMGFVTKFIYNGDGNVKAMTDFRGGITSYDYDEFGREMSVSYPDNTSKTISLAWADNGSGDVYTQTQTQTGHATISSSYDALKRETRSTQTLLSGKELIVLKQYDNYGHLLKTSAPYDNITPPIWNTYSYDSYDRVTSYTESSGATIKYSYRGNSVTTTSRGISKTQTYDDLGNLVSVTDPAGTISYQYAPDGNLVSITAPGNIKTTFEYDKYRRRVRLVDPSIGATTYEYDDSGNLITETDANGKAKKYEYDQYDRLLKSICPEFTTSYTYNALNELVNVYCSNGTANNISYDTYGRVEQWKQIAPDGKWLQKDYTYECGNVNTIKYSSQDGQIAKETYVYANGNLKGVKLNDTTDVYDITALNSSGLVSAITSGDITRWYDYTSSGILLGRKAASDSRKYQDFSYSIDAKTANLLSRTDNTRSITENFGYDELNRLTAFGDKSTSYDNKGNITELSDIGTFDYNTAQKPYAVSDATLNSAKIPTRNQVVEYTSFSRPKSISENDYIAEFTYSAECERIKMEISRNDKKIITRYYLGDCYELEESSTGSKERLYLGGDYYTAPAVLVKENGIEKVYNILRDHLGSITHIIDPDGNLIQELSYDAWGRLRNVDTQQIYGPDEEPVLFLGRGYTGHEHLSQFGLINMNARLYDVALGRFLSPDPYVQMPDFSQSFNRYSYCLNNPLCSVDKDGKFWHLIIGAVVGGLVNWVSHGCKFNSKGLSYFAVGAAVGTLSAMGGAWSAATFKAVGVAAGAGIGAASGGVIGAGSSFLLNGGNNLISGKNFFDNWGSSLISGAITGAITGAIGGGIAGGKEALKQGKNVWWGNSVKDGRTQWSLFNTEKPYQTIDFDISDVGSKAANDCFPTSLAEASEHFNGKYSYEDYQKFLRYKEDIGVGYTEEHYKNLLDATCNAEKIELNNLGSATYVQSLKADNYLINIDMPYNNIRHSDILRQIKFYHSGKVVMKFRIGSFRLKNFNNDYHFYKIKGMK